MIPKIIHQVWIGNKPIRLKHRGFMSQLKSMHPTWEYKFWNNVNIESILEGTPWFNKIQNSRNPIEIEILSDIIRFRILKKFGGIYSDIDCECVASLDPLLNCNDFFIGFSNVKYNEPLVIPAVFGTVQTGKIISNLVQDENLFYSESMKLKEPDSRRISNQIFQSIDQDTIIYNYKYFYQWDYETFSSPKILEPNAYLIHHYENTRINKN